MIKLNVDYIKSFINDDEMTAMRSEVEAARDKIMHGTGESSNHLGWRDLPKNYDRNEFARIKNTATKIRQENDILVVSGIGGSYLGARAVVELLGDYNATLVLFAGKDLSEATYRKIARQLEGKDWSLNIISKSGTTLEPSIAFDIFREKLIERYGEQVANQRIYATTDPTAGTLHDLAVKKGYEMFAVPDDIGGRYSVLTAVGLLPIAAAGVNIDELMSGAVDAMEQSMADAMTYATIRNALYKKGFSIENMTYFEPTFGQMSKWWQQLFGESEGKNGKGILPKSMIFTTDLHSLGQYIQGGPRGKLFETFINIEKTPSEPIAIPGSSDLELDYLKGKTLSSINQIAYQATVAAHGKDGIPVMSISLPNLNPRELGCFIYFMEMAAALSAYTMGVDPFNQPDVEVYKKEIRNLLHPIQEG